MASTAIVVSIKGASRNLPLLLWNLDHLASGIVTTARTDTMRQLRLLTVWAGCSRHKFERVMRTSLATARFRVASFRIRHLDTPEIKFSNFSTSISRTSNQQAASIVD